MAAQTSSDSRPSIEEVCDFLTQRGVEQDVLDNFIANKVCISKFIEEMQKFPELMKPLFVCGMTPKLTAQDIISTYVCEWSEEGSNRRMKEELTYVQFMDLLDNLEREDKLGDFLAWSTGLSGFPPLGFHEEPTIIFDHPGDLVGEEMFRKGLPFANTCSLQLHLPIMDDEDQFMTNVRNTISFKYFTAI